MAPQECPKMKSTTQENNRKQQNAKNLNKNCYVDEPKSLHQSKEQTERSSGHS